MKRIQHVSIVFVSVFRTACGPMTAPMPVRLEADKQVKIDSAWNDALNPIDRMNDVALLDALIAGQAYQIGVDRLSFRSEKDYSGGVVVMESQFNRHHPDADRFTVTLHDQAGRVARRVAYSREEVESAYRVLYVNNEFAKREQEGNLTAEEAAMLAEHRRRREQCEAVFPKFEESPPGSN